MRLAHLIMEAEKSRDLSSASCRPRKAGDIIQSKSKGLRSRESRMIDPSLRSGEGEMFFSSNTEAEKGEHFFFLLFCSVQALYGLDDAQCIEEINLFCPGHKFKC